MPNSKLRIGFVFDDSLDSSDGVAQYVKTLGAWLGKQGHEVRYLVGETKLESWSGGHVYSLAHNFSVSFNGNKIATPGPASRQTIREVLAKEHFDILHVQVPYSPFLAARVIKAATSSTAIIGTFHIMPASLVVQAATRLLGFISRNSLSKFDKIMSVSEAAKKFASQTFKVDSLVVPNVVDTVFFQKAKLPSALSKAGTIVFLGRLVERKGCGYLIDAFARLHRIIPGARLEIVGKGPQLAKLKSMVKRYGLLDWVTFHGFVSEQAKAKLLASADIACFPSTGGESFGIVLIEAMASGAGVVIGGDNPGYRSVLGAQEVCLFNPKNSTELAERLRKLLTNDKLSAEIHSWQQNQVGAYDVRVVGAQILGIYHQIIAKRRGTKA